MRAPFISNLKQFFSVLVRIYYNLMIFSRFCFSKWCIINKKEKSMNDFQTFSGFWCRVPGELPEYSLFRRKFRLNAPAELRLFVSADSRYNLYLDGRFLGRGPVRDRHRRSHHQLSALQRLKKGI